MYQQEPVSLLTRPDRRRDPRRSRAHLSCLAIAGLCAALLLPASAHGANPDAGRWQAQGGNLLFSGTHMFDRNYWTHQSVQGNLYWTDGEDQRRDRASHVWETEVRPAVEIGQGRFTVRGPGQIVAFVRQIEDTPMLVVNTATVSGATATFEPATRPGEQLSGWVLAGRTYTFDVGLEQTARFNQATGYKLYQAPQQIEFELWFFAGSGGRVVNIEDTRDSSSGSLFGGLGTGASSGSGAIGAIARVDTIQCARTTPGAPSDSFGTAISCGSQGLWQLDSRGNRLRQIAGGDGLSGGQMVETDAEAWARLSFDDNEVDAILILRPGTRAGLRAATQGQPAGIALFEGRLLTARELVQEQSLFGGPDAGFEDRGFEIETQNAKVGTASAGSDSSDGEASEASNAEVAFEVAYNGSTKNTQVIAVRSAVDITCKARPEATRGLYEGDRVGMDSECRANFDFPTDSELGALTRLAGFESATAGGSTDQQPNRPAGTHVAGTHVAGTYVGCYQDGRDNQERDLGGELLFPAALTPEVCVEQCAESGYAFAGLQWGRSCYCGNSYGRYGESQACDSRCAGDSAKVCGGQSANSVYATGARTGAGGEIKPPLGRAPRGVTLFQNGDFEGQSQTFLINVPALHRTSIGNDRASSVRVGAGCKGTLYEHSDYQGVAVEVTGDVASLGYTRLGNDEAGSLRVECE